MAIATDKKAYSGHIRLAPEDVHESLARHILADGYSFVWDHRASQGSYLVDQVTGKRYLDMFSFFASCPLTHNHPKMHTPEFREKMADLAVINPSNADVYTLEMAEAIETLARYAFPEYLPHLFFVAGGAPAVENALKAAFDWKVRRNLAAGKGELGSRIIHFRQAFHGRLGYTMSLTNTADPRKYMYFPRFEWPRVENPKLTFPVTEAVLEEVRSAEAQSLDQIQQAFTELGDDIAAIIIEPIQCEGGDNHFRPEFLQALRGIANEREALLIFDEVQTGTGLSGTMWAHEQLGVEPDILVFGKKMQICGIAASRRLDEVERNVFVEPSRINSTWGGNLVDYVRGQRYIEIIHEDGLLENAAAQGEYMLQQLIELQRRGFAISNVRGRGLIIAFDLADAAERDKLLLTALDCGLLILPCGTQSVRVRPHLDVRREAVEEALSILETILPQQ